MKNEYQIRERVRALVEAKRPVNDNRDVAIDALIKVVYSLIVVCLVLGWATFTKG
jgi:hypothetical protein